MYAGALPEETEAQNYFQINMGSPFFWHKTLFTNISMANSI